jgi:hypothetical protein
MNFFNIFRKKPHIVATHFDTNRIDDISETFENSKEKILYNSETSLREVLKYINNNASKIGFQLNRPATDIEIKTFENQKVELPEDFKLLYRFSNGFETDFDLFRLIPLDEIIGNRFDKRYLLNETSFHFTEYMIYSDMWSVDINKNNKNNYKIYNRTDNIVYLTNSLAEFLCVFINKGIYDGLYEWRERIQQT